MPRERSFSTADVLDRITDTFSTHGYGGTSLARLTEATGLGKQSLYNSFGDKQALYLQAVDSAVARFAQVGPRMQAAASGRAAVDILFEHLINLCSSPRACERQCIVSAGLLEGIEDPTIELALRSRWQASHELMRSAVERGQRDGSIKSPAPSAALADVLMATMGGLRVAAQVDANPARLRTLSTLMLEVLDRS